ncbi:hypothetical protein [Bartonella sp. WD16.2]|uniref:hypothetical protein n=1 Tax=Bartonella sp. WD16.2 TaxID=1933904 RepID=UPI000998EF25|nr:hypothetical protein [Bartonella sp. WD16.2]AQX20328.1 hypothetical protein BWD162_012300 [Bartonella sp. WD16.2]
MKEFYTITTLKFFSLMFLLFGIYYILFADIAFSAPLDYQKNYSDSLELIQSPLNSLLSALYIASFVFFLAMGWSVGLFRIIKFLVRQKAGIKEFCEEIVLHCFVYIFYTNIWECLQKLGLVIVNSLLRAAVYVSGMGKDQIPVIFLRETFRLADTILNTDSASSLTDEDKKCYALIVFLCFTAVNAFLAYKTINWSVVIRRPNSFISSIFQGETHKTMMVLHIAIFMIIQAYVYTFLQIFIIYFMVKLREAYNGSLTSVLTVVGIAVFCACFIYFIPKVYRNIISRFNK